MKSKNYLIVAKRGNYSDVIRRLNDTGLGGFYLITKKEALTLDNLRKISPERIFFPHWSHLIPSNIVNQYDCIVFHPTDVPFGRGGSPIQNLISRGIYQTKMTALKATDKIDAGPVYLKYPFSLDGNAAQIYWRAESLIEDMIKTIIAENPTPKPQKGKAVLFKRRTPDQSNLSKTKSLLDAYDFIRMLDADGYPHAFIETPHFRLEFTDAVLNVGEISARVKLMRKTNG